MAGERAGLRSGPARNESWMYAFELLDVCVMNNILCQANAVLKLHRKLSNEGLTIYPEDRHVTKLTYAVYSCHFYWVSVNEKVLFFLAIFQQYRKRISFFSRTERRNLIRNKSSCPRAIKMAWQVNLQHNNMKDISCIVKWRYLCKIANLSWFVKWAKKRTS